MITITYKQNPIDNPELEVVSPTGEYEETDIIQCAYVGETEPVCGFEARYILEGNATYR